MAKITKTGILILSPFFYPNVGGVETHLTDLTEELAKNNYHVYVLTYSPITTPNTPYKLREKLPGIEIRRYRWFGKTLFHSLEKFPAFDFLYITPYLLIRSYFWMLANHSKIDVIHSHGFNGAFIGNILARCFHKRHLTSTHAVYDHISGLYERLVKRTLNQTDHILCLSQSSTDQLLKWGINPKKISLYSYWVNLEKFVPSKTTPSNLTFLFVGRLIAKKGIRIFLDLSIKFPKYEFLVVGTGPESEMVKKFAVFSSNLRFLGFIPNNSLSEIYQKVSVLCVPSLYKEGFGRVVMEAVASGIPVIASNLGGLPEALDNSVAILVKPTLENFSQSVKKISQAKTYQQLHKNCRSYAQKRFSAKNLDMITDFYRPQ